MRSTPICASSPALKLEALTETAGTATQMPRAFRDTTREPSEVTMDFGRRRPIILDFAAVQTTSQTPADIRRRLGRGVKHCRSEHLDSTRRDEETANIWFS